jgi:hypothetical protein
VSPRPTQAQQKMTRAHKLRAGIIIVTVLGAATVSVLLINHPSQSRSLSLHFERYGTVTTMDLLVQKVGFFWITNSSARTYYLAMGSDPPSSSAAFRSKKSDAEGTRGAEGLVRP